MNGDFLLVSELSEGDILEILRDLQRGFIVNGE